MIYFQIDWFDLLAVQRTLKSLLQHHNSKASIHWRSKLREMSTGRSFWIEFSDFIMVFLPKYPLVCIFWLALISHFEQCLLFQHHEACNIFFQILLKGMAS